VNDACFVTKVESFYKVRLFQELSEKGIRVEAVFLDRMEAGREPDFFASRGGYAGTHLTEEVDGENLASRLLNLYKLISRQSNKNRALVLGGWDRWEYWVILFLSRFRKRVLIVESTIYEHRVSLIRDFAKRVFLSQVDECIVCSEPHEALTRHLGFLGKCSKSYGVGLVDQPSHVAPERLREPRRILFLGRLSPEKNLLELISGVVQRPSFHLTIAGAGPLAEEIESRASQAKNIECVGYVSRSDVLKFIADFDLLILPSVSETWGFVCDEAVAAGVPLLVSKRVGCASFFVDTHGCGLSFEPTSAGIVEALDQISVPHVYASLIAAVSDFDIAEKNTNYVAAFQRAVITE
jgi:glycosyltransferase involved in cell wall biosynthesis